MTVREMIGLDEAALKDGETPAECSQMNALYCKIGECPLRKELRTRPA